MSAQFVRSGFTYLVVFEERVAQCRAFCVGVAGQRFGPGCIAVVAKRRNHFQTHLEYTGWRTIRNDNLSKSERYSLVDLEYLLFLLTARPFVISRGY